MKARWRDGLKKFCRDNNVHFRGMDGRLLNSDSSGFDSWVTCGKSSKKYWGRQVHKSQRRIVKAELRDTKFLADVYWELYDLGWEDYSSDYLDEPEYFSFYDPFWEDVPHDIDNLEPNIDNEGSVYDDPVYDDPRYYRQYDVLDDMDLTVSNF